MTKCTVYTCGTCQCVNRKTSVVFAERDVKKTGVWRKTSEKAPEKLQYAAFRSAKHGILHREMPHIATKNQWV